MKSAIVVGAGTAGLLASNVLSRYCDKVYIIENDNILDNPIDRKGIPQQQHIHTLLMRGLQIFEGYYPELQTDMDKLGCPVIRWAEDVHAQTTGGIGLRTDIGIRTRGISRSALDKLTRQYTLRKTNITTIADARVINLIWNKDAVMGVRFEQGVTKEQHSLEADLVVIANGRNSSIGTWLQAENRYFPQTTTLNSHLGYASRRYKIPNHVELDSKLIAIQPRAKQQFYRGAAATQIENNEVIITLVGVNSDYPPTDETSYLDFARSLSDKKTAEWIESLIPISAITGYRPISSLNHYDQIRNYPDNLLIIGDALCSFNPFYGQGMSIAATTASLLDKLLSQTNTKNSKNFSRQFQKSLARDLYFPWSIGTGEDLRYPQTEGIGSNPIYKIAQYGTDFLLAASTQDIHVGKPFIRVMHMLDNPIQLLHPIYAFHCLRYAATSLANRILP